MTGQDQDAIRPTAPPARNWLPAPVVLAILLVTVGIELVLSAADLGLVGSTRWRSIAYQYGAFWPGLLDNWRPNYAAQPGAMFATYQVLHAGFWHLAGNMAVLVFLGRVLMPRHGQAWFLCIYIVSGVGGAIGFVLITDTLQPMVGASGALFGLAGAWMWESWYANTQEGLTRRPIVIDVIGLVLLNVLTWVAQDGRLAWESHLFGFLTGWLLATLLIRRPESREG